MRIFEALQRMWGSWHKESVVPTSVQIPVKVIVSEKKVDSEIPKNVPVLPPVAPKILTQFIEKNPSLIYRYMLKKLHKAVKNDVDEIALFYLPTFGKTAMLHREFFQETLQKMITHFLQSQEYELIPQCKILLSKLAVNDVIRRSKQV